MDSCTKISYLLVKRRPFMSLKAISFADDSLVSLTINEKIVIEFAMATLHFDSFAKA